MNNNMNINGTGTITEGDYNNISISGMGKLNGKLTANKINVSGTCGGEGKIKTNELIVNGHLKYKGNLEVLEKFTVNGHSRICEELIGGEINVAGNLSASKNIEFEEMNISGRLSCSENCEGTKFNCEGEIKIGGLLTGDSIFIRVYRGSNVREIGGENITIKADDKVVSIPLVGKLFNNKITVENIEGDNIFLEDTIAKKVSGKNIVIGKGCKIDEVNYSGKLDIKGDGKVYKENHVGDIKLLGDGK
ncbi:hypothetical protein [uncultured Clostridium sp.]|uniref:hypothetical protein n=1 Tax=uncultured Clostridium sp. TaxID=59620 RepID=UPI002615394D|nr:hypothetical protein [uncultured Clostridium sp.]